MPRKVAVRVTATSPVVAHGLEAIVAELGLPTGFPDAVIAEAERAAAAVVLPELDRTDLPFLTIDPAGSMDLDQAVHIEKTASGFVVHYAIADVASFVAPGGAIDAETRRRGETLYGAGSRIPLHPPALSEAAASLLPDQIRPALLWTLTLDASAALVDVHVARARVRSTARWSYVDAQAALEAGTAGPLLEVVREVGLLREAAEVARGGVSLPLPEQEIDESDGAFKLSFRATLPIEGWNAQISLLTGMAAASLMVKAKVGMLRTLPSPDPRDLERIKLTATALAIDWRAGADYATFIRSLDPTKPSHQAMVVACTRLLRGSGYAAFDGSLPEQTRHSAIAAEYAHVTAPLRRLGDRFAGEVCVAICAGVPVPEWVRTALPDLPAILTESGHRASAYDRAVLDLLEAAELADRVGESFHGVVTSVREGHASEGVLTLAELGVEAPISGKQDLPLGQSVTARLVTADPAQRKVAFEI